MATRNFSEIRQIVRLISARANCPNHSASDRFLRLMSAAAPSCCVLAGDIKIFRNGVEVRIL